jgi:hypothetical protein
MRPRPATSGSCGQSATPASSPGHRGTADCGILLTCTTSGRTAQRLTTGLGPRRAALERVWRSISPAASTSRATTSTPTSGRFPANCWISRVTPFRCCPHVRALIFEAVPESVITSGDVGCAPCSNSSHGLADLPYAVGSHWCPHARRPRRPRNRRARPWLSHCGPGGVHDARHRRTARRGPGSAFLRLLTDEARLSLLVNGHAAQLGRLPTHGRARTRELTASWRNEGERLAAEQSTASGVARRRPGVFGADASGPVERALVAARQRPHCPGGSGAERDDLRDRHGPGGVLHRACHSLPSERATLGASTQATDSSSVYIRPDRAAPHRAPPGITVGLAVDQPIEQVVAALRNRGLPSAARFPTGRAQTGISGRPDGNPLCLAETADIESPAAGPIRPALRPPPSYRSTARATPSRTPARTSPS